jgi:tetratricopeptide (TPR) repeat protein
LKTKIRRPDAAMLRWYEAALQGIPIFIAQHLKTNPDGSHPPAEAEIEVTTSAGKVNVQLRYPAGDLTQFDLLSLPGEEWDEVDEGEGEDVESMPPFDRRSMERIIGGITLDLAGESSGQDPDLRKAQNLMYDAWDEPTPSKRINLARQALKISRNCADAYVLLAEEDARTNRQALELYQKGVEAGRRALGTDFFEDPQNIGHFWGILETRPFMRALEGLANAQWAAGRKEETLGNFRELLRLNPGDNQGIRYQMLSLLLDMGQDEEAKKLMKSYAGDWSPEWAYTNALLAYRKRGDSRPANQALQKALEVNRYVPDYLTGKKRIPGLLPATITMGGEDQAVSYAAEHLNYWRQTPGAVKWLAEQSR